MGDQNQSSFGVFLVALRDHANTADVPVRGAERPSGPLPAGAYHSSFAAFLSSLRALEPSEQAGRDVNVVAPAGNGQSERSPLRHGSPAPTHQSSPSRQEDQFREQET
jgi:hypothetical protein